MVCCAICCNRLENAVKPQHASRRSVSGASCNRLENAVKPQHHVQHVEGVVGCNRLENAVKPQHYDGGPVFDSVVTD